MLFCRVLMFVIFHIILYVTIPYLNLLYSNMPYYTLDPQRALKDLLFRMLDPFRAECCTWGLGI